MKRGVSMRRNNLQLKEITVLEYIDYHMGQPVWIKGSGDFTGRIVNVKIVKEEPRYRPYDWSSTGIIMHYFNPDKPGAKAELASSIEEPHKTMVLVNAGV